MSDITNLQICKRNTGKHGICVSWEYFLVLQSLKKTACGEFQHSDEKDIQGPKGDYA